MCCKVFGIWGKKKTYMKNIKYSIITVCYNAEKDMADTINSVLMQSYDNYEYIIKDGCSMDRTMEIAHSLCDGDKRVIFIESRDQGIYDAMNIAVAEATGEYIFFLNAGDRFTGKDVLERVNAFIEQTTGDIFYGNVIEIGEGGKNYLRKYTKKNSRKWYYSLGTSLNHQGMFCGRELFQEKLFDLNYKVCADREWQLYHISRGKKAESMGITLAEVLTEGFSSKHVSELEKETRQCVKLYCGQWYILYRFIMCLKRNRLMHMLMSRMERLMSCRSE